MVEEQISCCICLEPLTLTPLKDSGSNIEKVVRLDCGHQFHFNCIKKINGIKCPLCRNNIINKSLHNKMCLRAHTEKTHFYSSSITKKGICRVCKKPTFNFYLKNKILKQHHTFKLKQTRNIFSKISFRKSRSKKPVNKNN